MRILQLTKKFPYPPKDGESVAILAMAKGYVMGGHQVDLMAMNTHKHHVDMSKQDGVDDYYNNYWHTDVNTDVIIRDAFTNLFSSESYNIERFNIGAYRDKLVNILTHNHYDAIQLETVYLTPYIEVIKEYSDATIILRSHNIEHEIWYNLSTAESNIIRKWYYNLCYSRLKNYELQHLDSYDIILPITDRDKDKYQSFNPKLKVSTAQVGIDLSQYNNRSLSSNCEHVGYIGSLDWRPNIEGLNWFFKNVWPDISREFPDLIFHLAGRNADPDFIKTLPSGVEFLGEVDNAAGFIDTLDGVIVPLLSGSGIRIKILESMAMSKTVFSTSKGFEGIDISDMENAILFNDPQEMVSKFRSWYHDIELRKCISHNSRRLIIENFDIASINRTIVNELINIPNK